MNALLYATNTQSQTVTDGQLLNLGVPVRRYGRNINTSGGNIVMAGEGYYPIQASVTFTAGGAGVATLQLYENGMPIPGGLVRETVVADSIYSLEVPTAIRVKCCEEKILSMAILGVDATVTNVGTLIEKS